MSSQRSVILGACRAWIAESENESQRGQFLQDSQAHSQAMGQEDCEKWTAGTHLQPATSKSDRLLDLYGQAEDCLPDARAQCALCGCRQALIRSLSGT